MEFSENGKLQCFSLIFLFSLLIAEDHFMANRWGNSERFLFSWAPKLLQMVTAAMKLEGACSL